jgi:hypothetical protein
VIDIGAQQAPALDGGDRGERVPEQPHQAALEGPVALPLLLLRQLLRLGAEGALVPEGGGGVEGGRAAAAGGRKPRAAAPAAMHRAPFAAGPVRPDRRQPASCSC